MREAEINDFLCHFGIKCDIPRIYSEEDGKDFEFCEDERNKRIGWVSREHNGVKVSYYFPPDSYGWTYLEVIKDGMVYEYGEAYNQEDQVYDGRFIRINKENANNLDVHTEISLKLCYRDYFNETEIKAHYENESDFPIHATIKNYFSMLKYWYKTEEIGHIEKFEFTPSMYKDVLTKAIKDNFYDEELREKYLEFAPLLSNHYTKILSWPGYSDEVIERYKRAFKDKKAELDNYLANELNRIERSRNQSQVFFTNSHEQDSQSFPFEQAKSYLEITNEFVKSVGIALEERNKSFVEISIEEDYFEAYVKKLVEEKEKEEGRLR